MSELAKALDVTNGAVSQTAARLEQKGYLVRCAVPGNRRQTLAVLTEKGPLFTNAIWNSTTLNSEKWMRTTSPSFPEEELRLILEYERRMTSIFSTQGKKPEKGGRENK